MTIFEQTLRNIFSSVVADKATEVSDRCPVYLMLFITIWDTCDHIGTYYAY